MPKTQRQSGEPTMPQFMSRFGESVGDGASPDQYQSQASGQLYWAPNNMLMTPRAVQAQSAPTPVLQVGESGPVNAYPAYGAMWNQYLSQLPAQGPVSQQNMPYSLMDVPPDGGELIYGYQPPQLQRKTYVPGPGYMNPEDARLLQSPESVNPMEYAILRQQYPRK